MSWNIETNPVTQRPEVVIKGFENGIADSPYTGIADMRNINVSTATKQANVAFANAAVTLPPTGYTTVAYTAASGTDVFTTASTSGFYTGMALTIVTVSGAGGVTAGSTYYVGNITATTFKLYYAPDTGILIDITLDISGTFTVPTFGTPSDSISYTTTTAISTTRKKYKDVYICTSDGLVWALNNGLINVTPGGTQDPNRLTCLGNIAHSTAGSPQTGIAVFNDYLLLFTQSKIDYININLIDENGYAKENPTTDAVDTDLPKATQVALTSFAKDLIASYGEGTRFLIESRVINEKEKDMLGSTVDFKAIEPVEVNGKPDIRVDTLDWKFTSLGADKEDIQWQNIKKWPLQMGEYVKMDRNLGITTQQTRKARMVPFVPTWEYAIPGMPSSGIVLKSLEVGNIDPKKESKLYLVPVPIATETTGSARVDALVKAFRNQYDKLYRSKFGKSVEEKREFLNQLSKAIRQLQVQLNFEPIAAIGQQFGIGPEAVRKIGNTTNMVNAAVSMGMTEAQARNILGIADTAKGGVSTTAGGKTGGLEDALTAIGVESEEGATGGFGYDDTRTWAQGVKGVGDTLNVKDEALANAINTIAEKIEQLEALALEVPAIAVH